MCNDRRACDTSCESHTMCKHRATCDSVKGKRADVIRTHSIDRDGRVQKGNSKRSLTCSPNTGRVAYPRLVDNFGFVRLVNHTHMYNCMTHGRTIQNASNASEPLTGSNTPVVSLPLLVPTARMTEVDCISRQNANKKMQYLHYCTQSAVVPTPHLNACPPLL